MFGIVLNEIIRIYKIFLLTATTDTIQMFSDFHVSRKITMYFCLPVFEREPLCPEYFPDDACSDCSIPSCLWYFSYSFSFRRLPDTQFDIRHRVSNCLEHTAALSRLSRLSSLNSIIFNFFTRQNIYKYVTYDESTLMII